MRIASGATRIVFIFNRWVLKIPNPTKGWIPFFSGFLANYHEGCVWFGSYNRVADEKTMLCPVLKFDLSGFWLVMRRAETIDPAEIDDYDTFYQPYEKITRDLKLENFGRLDGRIVLVDYA